MKYMSEYLIKCNHYIDDGLPILKESKPNYWRGSATKEGATHKIVSKRRNKAKIGKKQRKANRK